MSARERWARIRVGWTRGLEAFAGTPRPLVAERARVTCARHGGHFRCPTPGEITPCRVCGTYDPT